MIDGDDLTPAEKRRLLAEVNADTGAALRLVSALSTDNTSAVRRELDLIAASSRVFYVLAVLVRTTARWRRRLPGMRLCSKCAWCRRTAGATSASFTRPAYLLSHCFCAPRCGAPCARSLRHLSSSAPSVSCIDPIPSAKATTSTQASRASSTNTCGLDESRSVHALAAPTRRQTGLPDTYPFGL